jgi:signal transduction histidine kinase
MTFFLHISYILLIIFLLAIAIIFILIMMNSHIEKTLEKINKAALKFLTSLSLKETYKYIVKEAIQLVNGIDGIMFLREQGKFKVAYSTCATNVSVQPRKRGYTYQVFKTGKSLVLNRDEIKRIHPEVRQSGIKSAIFIPLSYEKEAIGVLIIRFLKDQYLVEKELDSLNLFGSLASLAIVKTRLYDETKQALETRDLFVSMAAHEFRTPLTSINGYVQLLYNKLQKKDDRESKWAKYLYWESMRLTNLVNELLSVNRIKSKELQFFFKECDIKNIIIRSLINFKITHRERKVLFKDDLTKELGRFIGDFDKLIQVFTNILDNAAKFSSSDKEIRVHLMSTPFGITIRVADQGKGIPKKELPYIFNEFYRGEGARHEGMGLGLYLSKYIIEQHKGKISIESKLDQGTTLIIELPKIKT